MWLNKALSVIIIDIFYCGPFWLYILSSTLADIISAPELYLGGAVWSSSFIFLPWNFLCSFVSGVLSSTDSTQLKKIQCDLFFK